MHKKPNHFSIDLHIEEDGHERSFSIEGVWSPGYSGTYYEPPEQPFFEADKVWQYGHDNKSLEPVSDEYADYIIDHFQDEIQEAAAERVEEFEHERRRRECW